MDQSDQSRSPEDQIEQFLIQKKIINYEHSYCLGLLSQLKNFHVVPENHIA